MAEVTVCLRAQFIDNDNSGVGRVRRLINNDRGVFIGRGIYNVSKGLETTAEAVGDR